MICEYFEHASFICFAVNSSFWLRCSVIMRDLFALQKLSLEVRLEFSKLKVFYLKNDVNNEFNEASVQFQTSSVVSYDVRTDLLSWKYLEDKMLIN